MRHRFAMLACSVTILLVTAEARAQTRPSPLIPPQSNAFGLPFAEWNALDNEFVLKSQLGGATGLNDTIGTVRLLPADIFNPTPVFDITLHPGTAFVTPPFFVFGERYDDPKVPDDDPVALSDTLDAIFADAQILTVLDGRTLLEGTGAELAQFKYGPIFFEEPVLYTDPQPRDGVHSVAALWAMGIGSVYRPLPIGKHTLVYTVRSSFFGNFLHTYNITVER